MSSTVLGLLKALYESEINVSLSSFWDGGWEIRLGDEMNGFVASETFPDLNNPAILPWLIAEACSRYPKSTFAQNMRATRAAAESAGFGHLVPDGGAA